MGGANSGRKVGYGRRKAEGSTPLDIRKVARSLQFRPGLNLAWEWLAAGRSISSIDIEVEENSVRLIHQNIWTNEVIYQRLFLSHTACHFGGTRPWFVCPGCSRRVAVIYGVGDYFSCRICNELPYESQVENSRDRAWKKAEKIRKRLGWPAGIANAEAGRPKGMHWKTYRRLYLQYQALTGSLAQIIVEEQGWQDRF